MECRSCIRVGRHFFFGPFFLWRVFLSSCR
nr:MAG TPA: hypothetical protein [Caudoviricetes sp.]